MEEVVEQTQTATVEKSGNVVIDVDNLAKSLDKCSGSPIVKKALSRKGSCRIDKRTNEEPEPDDASKKFVVKATPNNACFTDALDGRSKKPSRFTSINPRKILLFFATMSSMGTMILIYFTLAINRRGGV